MQSFVAASMIIAAASAAQINDEWIVSLEPNMAKGMGMFRHLKEVGIAAEDLIAEWNINNKFVGYGFRGSAEKMFMVEQIVGVKNVWANEEVTILDACQTQNTGSDARGLWGLSKTSRDVEGTYTYDTEAQGTGVTAYILDTGIRATHVDLAGNTDTSGRCASFVSGETCNQDGNGHGSHVAGTVGGATYGLAKDVTLVDVKVLGASGSGSFAGIISGVQHAVDDCAANGNGKCVANLSLGGSGSAANDAVIAGGATVTMVVASGNSNADACRYTPGGAGGASGGTGVLSVNSLERTSARSSFSNFGTCTDVFAPGGAVLSAWFRSDTDTNTISGTSMASPHVAGVVAQYLQSNNATPAQVKQAIVNGAESGVVTNPGSSSPNLLLQNRCA